MNCSTHPEAPAVAFCRDCGKALCADCRRPAAGTVYCAEHVPAGAQTDSAYRQSTAEPVPTHPRLAFVLGLIPGVGAIYNGQYAKGLVHAIIFGLIISILDSHATVRGLEPVLVVLLMAFVLYMAFEAYHTARQRSAGRPVDEFSGIFHARREHSSMGAVILIVLGAVFLLNTLEIVELHQILRFWPVLLILLGVNMLHSRMSQGGGPRGEV